MVKKEIFFHMNKYSNELLVHKSFSETTAWYGKQFKIGIWNVRNLLQIVDVIVAKKMKYYGIEVIELRETKWCGNAKNIHNDKIILLR